ncbi:MFS domain-containing protein [Fusarium keratoplasticum]|nr:MFS domain-containing protein [Fusarium keratoplasticum]
MSEAPRADKLAHDEEKGQCHHLEKHESHASAARDGTGARSKTNPAEIRLVRKLDWVILPMLWIMYWFNYLDRNAITVARLDNLEEELNLSSTEYQTCVSILFVGYILGQIPSNMLMTRLRPSLFMSGAMALWAVVSTLTAIAKDFKGLLLTRFFLGITEAPFYPGALYMLSIFYTRKEIATRISILFTANICGTAFAGLIAIGVFEMSGVAGLSGWR